jgi:hypothetical protein
VSHRNLGPYGLDLSVDDSTRVPGRVTPLMPGDLLCRTIGEPRWAIVPETASSMKLGADTSVHVLRPRNTNAERLVASTDVVCEFGVDVRGVVT